MATQICQRDVTSIVTRKLLHLALACIEDESGGEPSSQEEGRPSKRQKRRPNIFDASKDASWTSTARSQSREQSDGEEISSPSQRQASGYSSQQDESASPNATLRRTILEALRTLDQTERASKMDSTIDKYITLQHRDATSYRKAAQFFQVLRCVRKTLGEGGKIRQVRSLYYDNKMLFDDNQENVNECLVRLAKYWQVHSSSFNVLSGCRGQFAGPIWIDRDVTSGDGGPHSVEKDLLEYVARLIEDPVHIKKIRPVHHVPWVVIIEKETAFTERLQELSVLRKRGDDNGGKGFGLLVTGRGFPDHTTRRFLHYLRDSLPATTPFYTLMDGDAYGIQISQSFHIPDHHNSRSTKPLEESLKWIGLRPTQWRRYLAILQMKDIVERPSADENDVLDDPFYDTESCVSLDASEYQRAFAMIRRNDIPRNLQREVCKLIHLGFKLELEAAKHIPLHSLLP